MKVILLERIEKLGKTGDVVEVKNGYARNFLLSQKKALRSNKENMALFEAQKKEIEARNAETLKDAQEMAKKMEGISLILIRQASEQGQLYGSVTGRDIVSELKDKGYSVSRSQVDLTRPIKDIGVFSVKMILYPDVYQDIEITIARSEADAKKVLNAHKKALETKADEQEVKEEVKELPTEESKEESKEA
ncbi:MAG: 50S ribosomal protein L9 [Alphaproteobacteria bacterium]|nr:50S ribosomal protein L9 [Alphaproteobacteria bacterium]